MAYNKVLPTDPVVRFIPLIKVTKTCWLWKGSVNGFGYGGFLFNKKTTNAHRVSYILFKGEIPKGLFVLHKCDVPSCVNPAHLFLGTHTDNMRDCVKKGRHYTPFVKKTHCIRGHLLSETRPIGQSNCRLCAKIRSKKSKRKAGISI